MKKIDLVEKLKNVPAGTELYSTVEGKCFLKAIADDYPNPILAVYEHPGLCDTVHAYTTDGRYDMFRRGECNLFSSPKKLSWDLFHYAKAGEYVTVISLSRKGKQLEYACKVEEDGIFNVENSKVSVSCGVIGKRLVEVRAATEEEVEILNPSPKFKKGDIVVYKGIGNIRIGVVLKEEDVCHKGVKVDGISIRCQLGENSFIDFRAKSAVRQPTPKEEEEFELELREEHNHMINNDGDIVRWRARWNEQFKFVTSVGDIKTNIDTEDRESDEAYNSENYFPNEELAKKSRFYKVFHN